MSLKQGCHLPLSNTKHVGEPFKSPSLRGCWLFNGKSKITSFSQSHGPWRSQKAYQCLLAVDPVWQACTFWPPAIAEASVFTVRPLVLRGCTGMLWLHPLLASPSIPVTLPLTLCQTPFSPFLLLSLQVWATFPFKLCNNRWCLLCLSTTCPPPPPNPVPEHFRTWSSPYVSISRTSELITCSSKEHHVWWFQAPHFPWKWPSWVQDSFLTLSCWKRGEELLYVQCLQGGTIPDVIFKTKFCIFIDIPKPAALAPWGCFLLLGRSSL